MTCIIWKSVLNIFIFVVGSIADSWAHISLNGDEKDWPGLHLPVEWKVDILAIMAFFFFVS